MGQGVVAFDGAGWRAVAFGRTIGRARGQAARGVAASSSSVMGNGRGGTFAIRNAGGRLLVHAVLLHEPVGYAVPDELELVERLDVLVNILIFVADPQSYCPGNLMRTQLTSGLQHRYDLRSKPFVPRYPRP